MTTNPPFALSAPAGAAHAFLAPSAAARWVVCPGSALMEARYPEVGDAAAAADGTATHWLMAQMFEGWAPDTLLADGKTEYGHPIDADMVEAARMLFDDVRAVQGAALGPVQPVVEQPVQIPRIHPTANWGTPDVRMWVPDPFEGSLTLYVWDLKYGHKFVDVFENFQLLDYAAGILDERREVPRDRITVVFRIVQPRSYHRDGPIREWRVRAVDLEPFFFRLQMAAEEATGPAPECRPTPDACENCNARHACEALQRAAYRGMDLARQAQANDLTPAALGLEMRYLHDATKLMEARMSGLQAQAEAVLRRGGHVPHWKPEPGQAREVWTVPVGQIVSLGEMLGLDLSKPQDAITPTQARAAAKRKGIDPTVIGAFATRPSGAVKLTPDDGADARKVFAR